MTSLKETILKEFDNLHSKCIATDAQYTDKEMVEILSKVIKRNYEEDRLFIIKKLQFIEERVMFAVEEHDPSTDRKTSPIYWGNTLRTALSEIFKGRS